LELEMPRLRPTTKIDFASLMKPVALHLLGEPNSRKSKPPRDIRFGTNGSVSINSETGQFFDHEANIGGGVLDLIKHKSGCDHAGAVLWLRREGFLNGTALRSAPPKPKLIVAAEPEPKIVATYDYADENAKTPFQVLRYEPKTFKQRRPDGQGGWIWNLDGVRRVLYGLPDLTKAVAAGAVIHITEGEKDVASLRALGLAATTCPGGAKKWIAEYNDTLRGADVVLIGDNDEAGRDHVEQVAASLHGLAGRIRVLDIAKNWPACPDGGDVSDWIEAGGSADELDVLAEALPDWQKPRAGRLANFIFYGDAAPAPQMMLIDGVMPLQGLPLIGGQSSAGKTFIAVLLACCAASGLPFMGREVKQRVGSVIVAAEGRSMLAARIAAALQKLGVTEPVPISWVRQVPDFSSREAIAEFIKDLQAISERYRAEFGIPLGLVFVDTVSASFDIKEEADNAEAARVCKIMRFVSDQAETMVVPIHHYGKNAGVGLRGASAWRANADFVLSVMADIDPQTGNVTDRQLAIAKDRDGAQGPLTPFELVPVDLGVDENGIPWVRLLPSLAVATRNQPPNGHPT
jgi:AAA domain